MTELGVLLRSARDQKNVTIAQAATATHIKDVYLEALEEGEYALLPGPAYITGFLRNYAKYLGLHPDDVVQEYYEESPAPPTDVKAATRVLASGYESENRRRVLWALGALVLLFAGGFAVKQYNDAYGHAYSAPLVTPANLGAGITNTGTQNTITAHFTVRLRATAPVWVRVKVDGKRVYQGIMRARDGARAWTGHHTIYVATYDGAHVRVGYNGRPLGAMSTGTGLTVGVASTNGWQRAL